MKCINYYGGVFYETLFSSVWVGECTDANDVGTEQRWELLITAKSYQLKNSRGLEHKNTVVKTHM